MFMIRNHREVVLGLKTSYWVPLVHSVMQWWEIMDLDVDRQRTLNGETGHPTHQFVNYQLQATATAHNQTLARFAARYILLEMA